MLPQPSNYAKYMYYEYEILNGYSPLHHLTDVQIKSFQWGFRETHLSNFHKYEKYF